MLRRKRLIAAASLALPLLAGVWAMSPPTGASGRLPSAPGASRSAGASRPLAPARPVSFEATLTTAGFRIGGGLSGLYPGDVRTLHLKLTNILSVSITVTSIKTTVVANKASCPASYLHVPTFSGHVFIKARGTGSASVSASMLHAAPNACQGATFQLHYAGLGTAS